MDHFKRSQNVSLGFSTKPLQINEALIPNYKYFSKDQT